MRSVCVHAYAQAAAAAAAATAAAHFIGNGAALGCVHATHASMHKQPTNEPTIQTCTYTHLVYYIQYTMYYAV